MEANNMPQAIEYDSTCFLPYNHPSISTASMMADLEPDIMFHVADWLVADHSSVDNLLRINRHWRAHMELHSTFTTGSFRLAYDINTYTRHSIEDIKNWLMHPSRRQKLIHSFSLTVDNNDEYQAFCNLLDNQLSDVTFKSFDIHPEEESQRYSVPYLDFRFPHSLKARHLSLINSRIKIGFSWGSLGQALRDDLVSITIKGIRFDSFPEGLFFKSLRKLHVQLLSDSLIHQLNEFLQRHPRINNLSVSGYNRPPNQPALVIDSLHNLETLSVAYLPVDLESNNIRHIALKSLTYEEVVQPIGKWTGLTNTLTKLVLNVEPYYLTTASIERFEADHDIFNPEMFYKLENLKYFEYRERAASRFLNSFNSGLYDNAMPLLEELVLDNNHMTKEALIRFINSHKRLYSIKAFGEDFHAYNEEVFFDIHDTKANKSIYLQRNAY